MSWIEFCYNFYMLVLILVIYSWIWKCVDQNIHFLDYIPILFILGHNLLLQSGFH